MIIWDRHHTSMCQGVKHDDIADRNQNVISSFFFFNYYIIFGPLIQSRLQSVPKELYNNVHLLLLFFFHSMCICRTLRWMYANFIWCIMCLSSIWINTNQVFWVQLLLWPNNHLNYVDFVVVVATDLKKCLYVQVALPCF